MGIFILGISRYTIVSNKYMSSEYGDDLQSEFHLCSFMNSPKIVETKITKIIVQYLLSLFNIFFCVFTVQNEIDVLKMLSRPVEQSK